MRDRLQWIKLQPAAWAHWGAVRGGLQAHAALASQYPKANAYVYEAAERLRLVAIDKLAKSRWNPAAWAGKRPLFERPPPGSVDMLWANMALHEAADPQTLLAEWHRALAVNGFLMFSCLGPDTAIELRSVYAQRGWPPAGHQLTDMHDWGDMLVQAGFAEPVMDMERINLTFPSADRLLQELVGLGRNFHPARFAGLRGRRWKAELEKTLATELVTGNEGHLGLTFEVIYGHALKPQPKMAMSALSAVSVEDMRRMLQSSKEAKGL